MCDRVQEMGGEPCSLGPVLIHLYRCELVHASAQLIDSLVLSSLVYWA